MVTRLSSVITNYLIKREIVENSKQVIYQYGVLSLIVNTISVMEILTLGWLTNTFILSVLYILGFAGLRSFTGGFHFNHYISCNIVHGGLYLLSVLLYQFVFYEFRGLFEVLCLFGMIVIYAMSPVVHINKPMDSQKKEKNRLIAKLIVSNIYVISFANADLSILKYVIINTAILQLITKGGKNYVK